MRVVVTKQPILGNVATHPSKPRSISVSNENIAESPVNFHTNTTLDSTEEKIDETLEAAFSRRRGLRRKLKKMARRERESIH